MSEHLQSFLKVFSELESQINVHLSENCSDLKLASGTLQKLSRLVSENSSSIPSYELLKAQSNIEKLRTKILKLEQSLRPQKKFKFTKKKDSEETKQASQPKARNEPSSLKDTKVAVPTLSELCDQDITLEPSDTTNQDLWFDKLTKARVTIRGVPTALHLTHLNNCTIIGGPVLTSVFLENCRNCTLVVGCHQLRIHKTHECNFYLHVSSHPVVEECSECNFSPYQRLVSEHLYIFFFI